MMRSKKTLGQNFLTSRAVLADIILAAQLNSEESVLEIGPGKGFLTETLLLSAKKVIAVEKDKELIPYLKDKFQNEILSEKLILIQGDILKIPLQELVKEKFKVVANIPYNITGNILRVLLSGKRKPERVVLMVQKEVAERIVRRNGKESLLSISVQVFGNPKYVRSVSKKYFKPQPKVDSAVLLIENIGGEFFKDIDEEKFFTLLKTGFSHKRKLLIRNIEPLLKADGSQLFEVCSIDKKVRAEDVPLSGWKCLGENMA